MRSLTRASLAHYLPTNAMVAVGIAVAVAVLSGALLVGASVRASLRDLALSRLGATDLVVSSSTFFRTGLAADLVSASGPAWTAAPVIVAAGAVVHDESKRTAGRVMVYGIDERFGRFHHVDGLNVADREVLVSRALADEIGARAGSSLTIRMARPTDIPLSTLQGRRELSGERLRVSVSRVLEREALGEFSLAPSQGPVLAVFVPLARLQRDLELGDRVNTVLLNTSAVMTSAAAIDLVRQAVSSTATLDDLGLRFRPDADPATIIIEGRGGYLPPAAVDAIRDQAGRERRATVPVLTYVANAIRVRDRAVPYSTVAAIDAGAPPARPGEPPASAGQSGLGSPPIWLNEWAASDLDAHAGDEVSLEYFLWSDEEGLQTRSATFVLRGVTPMNGLGGDRSLTPDYPGISDAPDITSWNPPFPVDLSKVRKKDEDYWDRYRAAPKAIVSLADGQRLWGSRFGNVSSLRIQAAQAAFAPRVDPLLAGFSLRDARTDALAAATGTTDFGEYFLYFSFFLVVSALLLAYLFFALGLEQRTREVGLLAAVGFSPADIRRSFVREGLVVALIGAAAGSFLAVAYGSAVMLGLRTWWVGAVGTTALTLHIEPQWLAMGVVGALTSALMALWLGVRLMARRSARSLLTGTREPAFHRSKRSRGISLVRLVALLLALAGAAMLAAAARGRIDATAGFFSAGGLWLVAGLMAAAELLRRRRGLLKPGDALAIVRLGMSQVSAAPRRSVLSLALIAFACFVLVSVGAFRHDPSAIDLTRDSGTGGYALMGESVAPIMHDPNTPGGRAELGLESDDPVLAHAHITRFRLRPGDEASCLTLYKPTNPRIVAPEPNFLDDARFRFSASLASTPEERANPWRLLNRPFADGAIPAIADQTTLTYALHLGLGDDFVFMPDGHTPVHLRIVAALADSALQSEIVIGDGAFVRLFPRNEGYRVWLVEAPLDQTAALAGYLEDRLSDFGLDLTDTSRRLASYHEVENTYLATFQALGGLGLLLGTIGLGAVLARNVLERRRELALLQAVGFLPANLRMMVLSESLALVVGGVGLGTVTALVAIVPALRERAQSLPVAGLTALIAGVVVTGLAASLLAVRGAASTKVVDALKAD